VVGRHILVGWNFLEADASIFGPVTERISDRFHLIDSYTETDAKLQVARNIEWKVSWQETCKQQKRLQCYVRHYKNPDD